MYSWIRTGLPSTTQQENERNGNNIFMKLTPPPPINPNPAVLRNLTISSSEPSQQPLGIEVEAALKSLKSNKSPGPDGLQAELL